MTPSTSQKEDSPPKHPHQSNPTRQPLPFAQKSRLVVTNHKVHPTQPSTPQTSLLLSLSLAQKIHNLILASRQIEQFAHGTFNSSEGEKNVEKRIDNVISLYNSLREEVECELECVWVNAGLIPAQLPTFPVANNGVINTHRNKGMKRKRSMEEEIHQENRNKKQKTEGITYDKAIEGEREGDWSAPTLLQPIGESNTSIPLTKYEKYKMNAWGFESAWGCGEPVMDLQMSPRAYPVQA
ncbi:hypothetical protein BU24DRAFT_415038 [Aaosphaeria arxii CBS 175.79]|uniref:Uncharacterized protein n=1 Tax=Aaosphaeria arxii CBS 175.79 TaxID=1450172 RepID=A0A6A5X9U1_9PLEO|nr:uncharacterized protein BU24DRAFT_415038 [Aaosphaeria arxii CBS 175.79]KAF2009738.1 hypothetical protein BU24DRAFT_415038 [Aaosphaeria arxii CBS 175.79]